MSNLTPSQRFWRLLKPDALEIRNVYAYSIFSGLLSLTLPLGVQAIVNLIQGGRVSTSWILLVCLTVLGVLFSGLLQIVQLKITERLQQRIFTRAAFEFALRIPMIKMEALYKKYAPELMNRFFDTISVQKGLSKLLIDVTAAGLQVIFGLVLLSFYHTFFILFNIILVAGLYVLFRWTSKPGLRTSLTESKHKYSVAHWLEELARSASTFKLAGNTRLHLDRTNHHVGDYLEARQQHFRVLMRQYGFMVAFKVLVVAGLLVIGGVMVMEQAMNIGQFIAAEIIIVLVMNSVEKLVMSLETTYDVLTSLEKIGQVTDLELEDMGGETLTDVHPHGMDVSISGIRFGYPDQTRPLFDRFDMKLAPGERLLVTGPNGTGKSTLLQLLAGLLQPDEGHVVFNGQPLKQLDVAELRAHIGEVLGDQVLFSGSIRDNIALGRPAATTENVQWAIRLTGLTDWVNGTTDGIHSQLNPAGQHLPQNIIRRLLLARAICAKPALLVLENPLDIIAEDQRPELVKCLTDPQQPWTLVVVSEDPGLRAACTRTLALSPSTPGQIA